MNIRIESDFHFSVASIQYTPQGEICISLTSGDSPSPARYQYTANLGNWQVAIIDDTGRTLHTSQLQSAGHIVFNIRTDKLPSGVYHVLFTNNTQRIVRKLIVK